MTTLIDKISTASMRTLNAHFNDAGYSLWFVGGSVRDALLGEMPADFDFATDATPEEQIALYDSAGLRWIPTGLQHGTVTVLVDDEQFEVTTLRTEANHDGRHADMTFTRSIEDDLGRRDLTINAMALAFDGTLIDPYGGQNDLEQRKVRFVGSPDDRMREDYLRILRWLRFHTRIAGDAALDYETALAARRHAEGLKGISRERVWSEISKLMTYERPGPIFKEIYYLGISENIDLPLGDADEMQFSRQYTSDPAVLMAMYLRHHSFALPQLARQWKWSNDELDRATQVLKLRNVVRTEREMKFDVAVDGVRLDYVIEALKAGGRTSSAKRMSDWTAPTFPVTGNDLIAAGVKPGPDMGTLLKRLRAVWGHSDYRMTKEQLLAAAPQFGYPEWMGD